MKIAVCDDDQLYIDMLSRGIRSWQINARADDVKITAFLSAEALLSAVTVRGTFDLYFLDIDFGAKMNGYELAKELRQTDPDAMLIFVTNYDTYLKEGYELNVLRYFNKPVPEDKLKQVLELCAARLKEKQQSHTIRFSENERPVPVRSILYIEYSNHRLLIYTVSGEHRSVRYRESFADFCAALPENTVFLRCHQSFVVNMDHIQSFTASFITMDDGSVVPVSRGYKEAAFQTLRRFFTGVSS